MPVIVIGADTELGHAVIPALQPASGEIRLFASDADAVARYRAIAKIAIGDVSDGSHVGGAAIGAFCAIAITGAAFDDRERHFASNAAELFAQWADGLADAGIGRIILVGQNPPIENPLRQIGAEYVAVDTTGRTVAEVVAKVTTAEAAAEL